MRMKYQQKGMKKYFFYNIKIQEENLSNIMKDVNNYVEQKRKILKEKLKEKN